jgi:hypothetical protein
MQTGLCQGLSCVVASAVSNPTDSAALLQWPHIAKDSSVYPTRHLVLCWRDESAAPTKHMEGRRLGTALSVLTLVDGSCYVTPLPPTHDTALGKHKGLRTQLEPRLWHSGKSNTRATERDSTPYQLGLTLVRLCDCQQPAVLCTSDGDRSLSGHERLRRRHHAQHSSLSTRFHLLYDGAPKRMGIETIKTRNSTPDVRPGHHARCLNSLTVRN